MKKHLTLFAFMSLFTWSVLWSVPTAHGQNIQVFNGDDVNFGTWLPGDGNLTDDQFFCVYKDGGDSLWDGEANGSGAGGAFELDDGSGNLLTINNVEIRTTAMTPGVVVTDFPDADNSGSADCTEFGGDNQRLRLQLQGADLGSVPPGTYSGTLSITVTP